MPTHGNTLTVSTRPLSAAESVFSRTRTPSANARGEVAEPGEQLRREEERERSALERRSQLLQTIAQVAHLPGVTVDGRLLHSE